MYILGIIFIIFLTIFAIIGIKQTLLLIDMKYFHERHFTFDQEVHRWYKSIYKNRLPKETEMIWVFENHLGKQVYYKKDIIDRIKEIVHDIIENDAYENSDAKAAEILKIIEEAENGRIDN